MEEINGILNEKVYILIRKQKATKNNSTNIDVLCRNKKGIEFKRDAVTGMVTADSEENLAKKIFSLISLHKYEHNALTPHIKDFANHIEEKYFERGVDISDSFADYQIIRIVRQVGFINSRGDMF